MALHSKRLPLRLNDIVGRSYLYLEYIGIDSVHIGFLRALRMSSLC